MTALGLEQDERRRFVAELGETNRELAEELKGLLSADQDPSNPFSEKSVGERRASIEQLLGAEGSEAGELALPEAIGPFRIVSLLGSGGMGMVFEAEDVATGRSVALKVLRSTLAQDSSRRRFERETAILKLLDHEGIAASYESGSIGEGARPYFAMELVRGTSIDRHAAAHSLDLDQLVTLIAKVCDGLDHAHQQGIIHRDLKPDNILVTEESQPKILDFGIARALGHESIALTRTGEIMGTVAYMSPEQIDGSSSTTPSTDIYAVGCILYRLLTDQPPHELKGRTFSEVAKIVCNKDPRPLGTLRDECRGDLEQIVMRTLARDPHARYLTAGELASDLRRYLAGEPIEAPPGETWFRRLQRKIARRRRSH